MLRLLLAARPQSSAPRDILFYFESALAYYALGEHEMERWCLAQYRRLLRRHLYGAR